MAIPTQRLLVVQLLQILPLVRSRLLVASNPQPVDNSLLLPTLRSLTQLA